VHVSGARGADLRRGDLGRGLTAASLAC